MDKIKLGAWIARWEGRSRHVYMDTEGHPTVGIGFNLDRPQAKREIEALGLDYDKVRTGAQDLTDGQIDQLFSKTTDEAISGARQAVTNFDDIPEDKQVVLVDMVFNLGVGKFSKFRKTIDAVEKEDWLQAALEMKDSAWFAQVGAKENQRGGANVRLMQG